MMRKDWRLQSAYDYAHVLTMENEEYRKKVSEFLEKELQEDLDGLESIHLSSDLTTNALFSDNKTATAYIKAKQDGVIAGLDEVSSFYEDHGLEVEMYKEDGSEIRKGEKIMEIKGSTKTLLNLERTGLNLLQRMSGIATTTKNLTDKVNNYDTVIVATRKTQNRYLDKRAVSLGGGLSHRLGLYDGIMIKDTHLDSLKREGVKDVIEESIERASNYISNGDLKFIEIEVSNLEETLKAGKKFRDLIYSAADKFYKDPTVPDKMEYIHPTPHIIMLDNMTPSEIKKVISRLKKEQLRDYVLLEASGMINESNVHKYAKAGVDIISLGCLTHSVKSLDLSQKIVKEVQNED